MNTFDDFDELAGMLPFYVNGRLSAEQRARVEAALETMPELRDELREVQAVAALVKDGGTEWAAPTQAPDPERLRALQRRIEAQSTGTASVSTLPVRDAAGEHTRKPARRPTRFGRLFEPPYSMALAAGLAAVACLQGAMLYRQSSDDNAAGYASLSGPSEQSSGQRFTLRLKAQASWGDIQSMLDGQSLRIVAGPQDGMIDVAPATELTEQQLQAIEDALRASPAVAFVGRGS